MQVESLSEQVSEHFNIGQDPKTESRFKQDAKGKNTFNVAQSKAVEVDDYKDAKNESSVELQARLIK